MPSQTVDQGWNKVLVWTRHPLEASFDYPDFLEMLFNRIAFYRTKLTTVKVPWLVNFDYLTVNAGQNTYKLDSFTQPVARVTLVQTYDPTLPNFVQRKIDMVSIDSIGDAMPDVVNPSTTSYGVYAKHNAVKIACYGYSTGNPTMYFSPTPVVSCQYKVWYDVGKVAQPTVGTDQIRIMPEFDEMVFMEVALTALGGCRWENDHALKPLERAKLDSLTRQSISASLTPLVAEYKQLFDEYIRNNKEDNPHLADAYNRYRDGNGTFWGRYGY